MTVYSCVIARIPGLGGKRKFCLVTGTGLAFSIQTPRKEPAIMLSYLAVRSLSIDAKLLVWTSSILRLHELSIVIHCAQVHINYCK
jgi:hypothetical protein